MNGIDCFTGGSASILNLVVLDFVTSHFFLRTVQFKSFSRCMHLLDTGTETSL